MSEQQTMGDKYPDTDINWSRNKTGPLPEPRLNADPTTAALDALRSAVVAQTALLRSLSEQIRLFETNVAKAFELTGNTFGGLNGALDGLASTIGHFYGDTGEALAGLAERLEKHGKMFSNIHDRLELYSGFPEALLQVKGHLAAIEAKLTPPDAERIFTPEELRKLERDFKFKPLRTTRPAPKGAAQRKAKR